MYYSPSVEVSVACSDHTHTYPSPPHILYYEINRCTHNGLVDETCIEIFRSCAQILPGQTTPNDLIENFNYQNNGKE